MEELEISEQFMAALNNIPDRPSVNYRLIRKKKLPPKRDGLSGLAMEQKDFKVKLMKDLQDKVKKRK